MKKKVVVMMLFAAMIFTTMMFTSEASAATIDSSKLISGLGSDVIIRPNFVAINSYSNGFDIVDGEARIISILSVSADRAVTSVYLRKYTDDGWERVHYWNEVGTGDGYATTYVEATYDVTPGTYKIICYGKAYSSDGECIDSTVYTSYTVTY